MVFFSLLLSLIMYSIAPQEYNNMFCWCCLVIYFLDVYLLLKKEFIKQPVSFNTFFLLSFFFVSYVYPLFIVPSGLSFFFDPKGMVISNNINACTALCTVAASAYTFGFSLKKNRKICELKDEIYYRNVSNRIKMPYYVSVVLVIVVLYSFFTTKHDVEIEVQEAPFLFVIFLILTVILFVTQTKIIKQQGESKLKTFLHSNKQVVFISIVIMLIYTVIGDRLLIIELGLIMLSVYAIYYKNVKLRHLLVLLVAGVFFMTLLAWTRGGESSLRSGGVGAFVSESGSMADNNEGGIWGFSADLAGRFQELSYGYYLTEQKGHQYPLKIFATILSPIPFLPNVVSNIVVGVPTTKTSAGYLIANDSGTNAGSHCVIDVYMPWGLTGTVLIFILFGWLVAYVSANRNKNLYFNVIYIILIYQSVFIARGTLFDIYRSGAWAIIIIYLVDQYSKRNKRKLHATLLDR